MTDFVEFVETVNGFKASVLLEVIDGDPPFMYWHWRYADPQIRNTGLAESVLAPRLFQESRDRQLSIASVYDHGGSTEEEKRDAIHRIGTPYFETPPLVRIGFYRPVTSTIRQDLSAMRMAFTTCMWPYDWDMYSAVPEAVSKRCAAVQGWRYLG